MKVHVSGLLGHPTDEKSFYFCGRSSLKDFSYCRLHILWAYQPKGKKEEACLKKMRKLPQYIEKKVNTGLNITFTKKSLFFSIFTF